MSKRKSPAPPGHLTREAAAWWSRIVSEYELEDHHQHQKHQRPSFTHDARTGSLTDS